MRHRALVVTVAVLVVVLGGAVVVYAFGTPQTPASNAPSIGDATAEGMTAAGVGEAVVTDGDVPEADPSSPLAIQIPGCVCHSDDPALVEEHAEYRMNQCFGCHSGGMPDMGR